MIIAPSRIAKNEEMRCHPHNNLKGFMGLIGLKGFKGFRGFQKSKERVFGL